MATIWKFQITLQDEITLTMPQAAELLFLAVQHDIPCLWARVDPANPTETRRFKLRGTGHEIDRRSWHIGSFMLQGGDLVLHLFEAPKSAADV